MSTSNDEALNNSECHDTAGRNPLMSAAIDYAMNGLAVLPVHGIRNGACTCGRASCPSPGKHPITAFVPNGLEDATTDVETIKAWWEARPCANIGIRTGKPSGVIVVDIDSPSGETALVEVVGALPQTWHSTTGKGHHYYLRHPGGDVGSPTGIVPHVDIRGDGGYVVASPSRHKNGATYEWSVCPSTPLAECPAALLELITRPRRTAQVHETQVSAVGSILEGQRNSTLFAFARRMRRAGATYDAMLAALREQNKALCCPPLEDEEVIKLAYNAHSLADHSDFTQPMGLVPFRSSLPSKSGGQTRNEFAPLTAAMLLDEEEETVDWVFQDYLPVGGVVILAAKPKTGKTTLVYHLVAHVARGLRFLDRETTQTAVLILAVEEHKRDVKNRLRKLGVLGLNNIHVQIGRFDPPNLERVRQYIVENHIGLVVVDTLAAYWDVRDEINASQVTAEVMPLVQLARETNACVLLIHHCRKADGMDGDEIRGSGALFACVDIGIICKGGNGPTQRVLTALGRYAETPKTLVIELGQDGYKIKGDTLAAAKESDYQNVLEAFAGIDGVCELAARTGLKPKKVREAIKHWADQGKVTVVSPGRPRHPARYERVRSN